MTKQLGKKYGVTSFWKNEQFSNHFDRFSSLLLCFFFILRNWLRKNRFLLVFFNLKEFSYKILVSVGIYRFRQKRKKKKSIGYRQIRKIQKFRWRRKEKTPITPVTRLNREGLRPFSTTTKKVLNSLQFFKTIKKKEKKKPDALSSQQVISALKKKIVSINVITKIRKSNALFFKKKIRKSLLVKNKKYLFRQKLKKKIKIINSLNISNKKLKKNYLKIIKNEKKKKEFFIKISKLPASQVFSGLLKPEKRKQVFDIASIVKKKSKKKNFLNFLFLKKKKIKKKLEKKNPEFLKIFEKLNKHRLPWRRPRRQKKTEITGPRVGIFFWKIKVFKKLKFLKRKRIAMHFEKKFSYLFNHRFFFKYYNIFKTLKVYKPQYRMLHDVVVKRNLKVSPKKLKTFLKSSVLFSLKKISIFIFRILNKQWFMFKHMKEGFIDFINISNFSFFFLRADYLPPTVARFMFKKHNLARVLKMLVRLLQFFYPVYCTPPVSRTLRLSITGKLGGQRKRRFRNFLFSIGNRGAPQKIAEPADFCFLGIWNYTGSFGLKSWMFGPSTINN